MAKREIKFRGERDNGEIVVGHYCVFPDGRPRISVTTEKGISHYLVKPESVGQFIGITDTFGTEIFEGMELIMLGVEVTERGALHNWTAKGIVRFSGTSFGFFDGGCWYGIDGTEWDVLKVVTDAPKAITISGKDLLYLIERAKIHANRTKQ